MAEYEIFGPDVAEVIRDVRTIVHQEHGWNEDHIDDRLIRQILGSTSNFGSYRGYWCNNLPCKFAAQTCTAQTNSAVKMFRFVDKHIFSKCLPLNTRSLILSFVHHCKHTN